MQAAVMWNTPAVLGNGGGGGQSAAVCGRKRRADESSVSSDAERFAKRFNLLNIGPADGSVNGRRRSSNYYIPLSPAPSAAAPQASGLAAVAADHGDSMQVDETRDRVYIHNMDQELAEIASDEEKLIFLPDIEKHFSRIPQHVLAGRRDDDHEGQELVLYSMPKALTTGAGPDAVRRAIIEARHRARDKAAAEARQADVHCKSALGDREVAATAPGYGGGCAAAQEPDPDAMDMD